MHQDTKRLIATCCNALTFDIGSKIAGVVVICHGVNSQILVVVVIKKEVHKTLFPKRNLWHASYRNMIYSDFVIVGFFVCFLSVLLISNFNFPKYIK